MSNCELLSLAQRNIRLHAFADDSVDGLAVGAVAVFLYGNRILAYIQLGKLKTAVVAGHLAGAARAKHHGRVG